MFKPRQRPQQHQYQLRLWQHRSAAISTNLTTYGKSYQYLVRLFGVSDIPEVCLFPPGLIVFILDRHCYYREGLPRRAVKSGQVVDEPSTLLDTVGNHSSCHYIGFYSAWHGGITTAGVGVFHGGISRGSIVSLGTFSLEPGAAKGLRRNMHHAERPTCQRPVYMLPVHFASIP